MSKLSEIFDISYGNKFDYNKMFPCKGGIAFISRSSKNNGIVDYVKRYNDIEPFNSGAITVTLGGTYLLSAFIQNQPFYTAQNIAVLTPRIKLTKSEILYYCTCLGMNRYRYSAFGREANVSLSEIELPDISGIPEYIKNYSIKEYGISLLKQQAFKTCQDSYPKSNACVPLHMLFNIENGVASSQVIRSKIRASENWIPYVRPSYRQETSIDAYVNKKLIPENKIFPAETLYVSTDGQGSHTYSYVSAFEFVANSNVAVLIPKREMGLQEKLFYAQCITNNRYKFSYGRKPKGDRLEAIMIPEFPPEYVTSFDMDKIISSFGEVLEKV